MKAVSLFAAFAAVATTANADWLLSPYPSAAPDSATVNALYGIQSIGNHASTTAVSVPTAAPVGYVSLNASKIASDGDEGFTANVGMLHPLRPDWSPQNVSEATAIEFEVRFSVVPADGFEVSLSSDEYPKVYANVGKIYTKKFTTGGLPKANTWKKLTIDPTEFVPPDWFCIPEDIGKPCPTDFPTRTAVMSKLKALQFAPKVKYLNPGTQDGKPCPGCVTPTQTAIIQDIRNVTFVGIAAPGAGPRNPNKLGCDSPIGQVSLLDDFTDGDGKNLNGGNWFAVDDRDTSGLRKDSVSVGNSKAAVAFAAGDATVGESGYALLTAKLDKSRPGANISPTYHKYAGWGAIGTKFFNDGLLNSRWKLSAIEFVLKSKVLSTKVDGVTFKVALQGVDDAHVHSVIIPTAQIQDLTTTSICVRPEDLAQPSWLDAKLKTAFDASLISQLAWEVRIADQVNPSIVNDSVAFTLTDIKLHRLPTGSVKNKIVRAAFAASYRSGVLSLNGFSEIQTLDVLSLTGKKITSLIPTNAIQLSLDRGTYVLVAKGSGKTLIQKLVVLNR